MRASTPASSGSKSGTPVGAVLGAQAVIHARLGRDADRELTIPQHRLDRAALQAVISMPCHTPPSMFEGVSGSRRGLRMLALLFAGLLIAGAMIGWAMAKRSSARGKARPPAWRTYKVLSASMEPTLKVGQRIIVRRPGRGVPLAVGRIVVYHPPRAALVERCAAVSKPPHRVTYGKAACERPGRRHMHITLIKRIVAGPKEWLYIKHGHVFLARRRRGPYLREHDPYVARCGASPECNFLTPIQVPAGDWFLMGDNRGRSADSRFYGPVPTRWILGVAPLGSARLFPRFAVESARQRVAKHPHAPAAWAALTEAHLHVAVDSEYYDSRTGRFTRKGRRQLRAAARSWKRYLRLKPARTPARLAMHMAVAFSEQGLDEPVRAMRAMQIVTEDRPHSARAYAVLATFAYRAHKIRQGDRASQKAIALVSPPRRALLERELEKMKDRALAEA